MKEQKDEKLAYLKNLLANYEEILVDMDDDESFIARGNGFCDRKYSEEFLEMKIADIKEQIAAHEKKMVSNKT